LSDVERYRTALLDWLACATRGTQEPATLAARAAGNDLLDRVAAAGTAGHVLDYDDTYAPGLAHLSAAVAPAALVLAGELERTLGDALNAYVDGFEAAGALAKAGHPALYDGGWHPTAVCGSAGAAFAAARLLELDADTTDSAVALAFLRAAGLRAAFGSDGKALQVGMAAAAGVQAARIAAGGASVPLQTVAEGEFGYEQAFGAGWARLSGKAAVKENWIKPYPCCLAAHSSVEAAAELHTRRAPPVRSLTVVVHPQARRAAVRDDVESGLEAKFSIPYLTAYTLLHGPPAIGDFDAVDADARRLASAAISIREDDSLLEFESRLQLQGETVAAVEWSRGSPQRPLDAAGLATKVRELAGNRLDGVLDDLGRPARDVLSAAGLSAG
jgi:2-methylcitrate dehydratase PrpD